MSATQKEQINAGLVSVDRTPLPRETAYLRHLQSGRTAALDRLGNELSFSATVHDSATPLSLGDEVKKVVAGCRGVGAVGSTGWKAIGEDVIAQLTNWKTAVKFVIRRIGVAAAVSCMGGIVWKYI